MSSNSTSKYPPGYMTESNAAPMVGTAIAFIVLVSVSYALRFASRIIQTRSFYRRWIWADFFMLLSLIMNIGVCVVVLIGVHYGAGKHMAAVPSDDIVKYVKIMFYVFPCIYLVAVVWSKLAILDLYLQVLVDQPARIACYVTAGIIVLNSFANIVATILQCLDPFSEIWHPTPGGGHCIDTHMHFVWASFPNIVTDIMMLFIPLPMILSLKQSTAVKLGVLITFLIGNVGLATSIVRLVEFYQFGWGQTESDATWQSGNIMIWNTVEPGVYHIAACFMSLRPLLRWTIVDSPAAPFLSSIFGRLASAGRYGRSHLSGKNSKSSNEESNSPSESGNASSMDSQLRSEMRDTFNANQTLPPPPLPTTMMYGNIGTNHSMPPYPPPDYIRQPLPPLPHQQQQPPQSQPQQQQQQQPAPPAPPPQQQRQPSVSSEYNGRDGNRDSMWSDNGRTSNGFITVRHDISIRSNVRSEQLGPTSQNDLFTPPTSASY